jgi:hypothetical protein
VEDAHFGDLNVDGKTILTWILKKTFAVEQTRHVEISVY